MSGPLVSAVSHQLSRSRAHARRSWHHGGSYDLFRWRQACTRAGQAHPSASPDDKWILARGRDIHSGEGRVGVSLPCRRCSRADDRLSALAQAGCSCRPTFLPQGFATTASVNPRTITVDKNAAYPIAAKAMKQSEELWRFAKLRQVKFLNNIVEQDHRRSSGWSGPGRDSRAL